MVPIPYPDSVAARMKQRFKVCPKCGFPVVNDELAWLFRGKQRRIYETVAAAGTYGIARERLVEMIYADEINGGPDDPCSSVTVTISQVLNPRLAPHGLKIKAGSGSGANPYRLVTLPRASRR